MLEPIQIVELWQPRCSLRFGVAPCTASTDDGPRCYNCWGSCLDLTNYKGDGSIAWRFMKPTQALVPLYERTGEHIKTNPLPLLVSVSVRSSKINVGSIRDGERPLGVTGSCTITLKDAPWDDVVGDYYKSLRTVSGGNFWAKWVARNPFYANMRVTIYEGYAGQSLAEMERRLYILDNVTGPDSQGSVTLTAVDPLRLTDNARAQFPRETDMRLSAAIDAATTSITIEAINEHDLWDQFGTNKPEKARTNLVIWSERFDNAAWAKSGVTVTANAAVAPDGSTTAEKFSPNAGTAQKGMSQPFTGLTVGDNLTAVFYAKKGERDKIQIRYYGGPTGVSSAYTNFDLTNGTYAGTQTGEVTMANVGNGWWRCRVTTQITGDLTGQDVGFEHIDALTSGRSPTISTGNGSDGLYIWGAQVQPGIIDAGYIGASGSQVINSLIGAAGPGYILIGSEVIRYNGYSGSLGVFNLIGVARGQLGTTASSHSEDAGVQRVGRYELTDAWDIAHDLLINHTEVPDEFIDKAAWDAEAGVYLQGYAFSRTVTKPTAVNNLLGELLRDGTFYIWWDERSQTIPLKAIRPEHSDMTLSDNTSFVSGSLRIDRVPDERISRVFVYFGQIDPTKGDDPTNFLLMRGRIDADAEREDGGAEIRSKTIYSKWIVTDAQALELNQRLLARYGSIPKYLTVTMTDQTLEIGEVVNVQTRVEVDTEGQPIIKRWQIIAAQQLRHGEAVEYQLQEFIYQATRFGRWTADAEIDYSAATAEYRDGGSSAWWSDDDGKMPDGQQGYRWQ